MKNERYLWQILVADELRDVIRENGPREPRIRA
jgi:hypothetical protein